MARIHPTWIGFDLDGVLAKTGLDGEGTPFGDGPLQLEPVASMIALVKDFLADGYCVKVFTARTTEYPDASERIQEWLVRQGLPPLEVTNAKDTGLLFFYDDRVRQVVPNTGQLVAAGLVLG